MSCVLCCPHALNVDPCSFNGLDIRIPIIIPLGEGVYQLGDNIIKPCKVIRCSGCLARPSVLQQRVFGFPVLGLGWIRLLGALGFAPRSS